MKEDVGKCRWKMCWREVVVGDVSRGGGALRK